MISLFKKIWSAMFSEDAPRNSIMDYIEPIQKIHDYQFNLIIDNQRKTSYPFIIYDESNDELNNDWYKKK